MAGPSSIAAGLQALKTATGIVKKIREIDRSVEAAEMKMQLAELLESLSEAKTKLVEAQEENIQLRERIKSLESVRDLRAEVKLADNVYVPVQGEVESYGSGPWCSKCFEADGQLISLHHKVASAIATSSGSTASYKWVCPNCGSSVRAPKK